MQVEIEIRNSKNGSQKFISQMIWNYENFFITQAEKSILLSYSVLFIIIVIKRRK